MIAVNPYEDRPVGVLGLGRSGLAAAKALMAAGGNIEAWDDDPAKRGTAVRSGIPLADLDQSDWSGRAALVLSPGIPLTHPAPHPVVAKAQAADVPVIGDLELFMAARADLPPASFVAVTGTNGKSTTTALIAHVLQSCGMEAAAGGNIGRAVLDLDPIAEGGAYVVEVSSFQIDLAPSLKPDIGVLLNIAPDHLDRHGDIDTYVAVKQRLFANQEHGDCAIVGTDDPYSAEICRDLQQHGAQTVIPVAAGKEAEGGIYVREGMLIDDRAGDARRIGDLSAAPALKGPHNWQNAAAAYAVAVRLGCDRAAAFKAILRFPGLAHRTEIVAVAGGVTFVNDSKATNQAAAARALAGFDKVHWIAGGIAKEPGLETIRPLKDRIVKAYLIGRDARTFAAALEGVTEAVLCDDLETAVRMAAEDAAANGGVVLLSPAAASQDQFRDYEARGDTFRALAQNWAEAAA